MASTGEVWKLGHRPALDGLRGLAVIGVVVCHVQVPYMAAAGNAGVSIFFALSGFLITALLLQERARTGRTRLSAFFARRALRLLPALVVYVVVVGAVSVAVGRSTDGVLPALLYVGNWAHLAGVDMGLMKHTWSLSVEEQFYLLWPLVVIGVARFGRWAVLAAAGVGVFYSLVVKLLVWDGTAAGAERVYYASDAQAGALLVGCALAVFMHNRGADQSLPSPRSRLAVAALLLSWVTPSMVGIYLLVPTAVPALAVVLIYGIARGHSPRWATWRPLVLVGQRSYGLYLWHFPFTQLLLDPLTVRAPWPVAAVVLVALSWAATCLSWWLVEAPFLRLKARSVGGVEPAEREPDQGVVLPGEGLHLGGDLRVRR